MTFDRISGQFPGSVINGLMVTIPPRHKSTPITHPGEELVYVHSGSLRYTLGGRKLQLDEGDAVHLPSSTPHCWENPFSQPAKALCTHDVPDQPCLSHALRTRQWQPNHHQKKESRMTSPTSLAFPTPFELGNGNQTTTKKRSRA
jgi:quercetin dioxygenase-like cupin family protein